MTTLRRRVTVPIGLALAMALVPAARSGAAAPVGPSHPSGASLLYPAIDPFGPLTAGGGGAGVGAAGGHGRLPLSFEPNRGQFPAGMRYVARGAGYALGLSGRQALLSLRSGQGRGGVTVGISFAGGASRLDLVGERRLPGEANYLIGRDRSGWRTHLSTFGRVAAREVWPGISAVFYGRQASLNYDFRLAARADPNRILLAFPGARYARLDRDGALMLGVAGGELRQPKPRAYQMVSGSKRAVAADYRLSHARVAIALAGYDHHLPLVIDPGLDYSTYLGGSSEDNCGTDVSPVVGTCVAIDATGHAYITGVAESTDFPTTPGAYQTRPGGATGNAFVAKLTPGGNALEYATYLGGPTPGGYIWNRSIAVDSRGAAYITGNTNEDDFPTTPGAYVRTSVNGAPYVSKLSPDGSSLEYSTYLCGSPCINWLGMGLAVDSTGHAYAGGWAGLVGNNQAFVLKLNPTGSALDYEKFFGGSSSNDDLVYALALDSANNVYATGTTFSDDFPTTSGAFQRTDPSASKWSAFVTKLDSSGNIVYSTYLAGDFFDWGNAIAVDSSGAAYVTGDTFSTTFPTTPGAYQRSHSGGAYDDAFVTKLSPDGSTAEYSTYLGRDGVDIAYGIAVDAAKRALVVGETRSGDFPTTAGALRGPAPSAYSAFVTALNPQGSGLTYSTLLGDATQGKGIALDPSGAVYLGGFAGGLGTGSGGLPTTPGAFQTQWGGIGDAFVAKFHPAFLLSVAKGGSGAGTVTSAPAGVNCGSTCEQAYNLDDGTQVTLTATPASGSAFAGWAGACSGSGPCTVTMTADRGVAATFIANPQLLPAKASFAGSKSTIRPDRKGSFQFSFHATPGLRGSAVFKSGKKVRTSRKQTVTLARKTFTVPAGGKVTLKIQLSRKTLRILRLNRQIRTQVTIVLKNAAGHTSTASKTITVKAPRR